MTACKDFDLLISLRAAGALEPAEATRLDAHLESCAACRAEADADAEVLGLAKLPPLTEAERRAANGLARDVVAELHRTRGPPRRLEARRRRLRSPRPRSSSRWSRRGCSGRRPRRRLR